MEMYGLELTVTKKESGITGKNRNKEAICGLSEDEKIMLTNIGYDPVYIDDLIRANKMDVGGTLAILRKLEEKNIRKVKITCLQQ